MIIYGIKNNFTKKLNNNTEQKQNFAMTKPLKSDTFQYTGKNSQQNFKGVPLDELGSKIELAIGKEDYHLALGLYKNALEFLPKDLKILTSKANLEVLLGKHNDAIETLNKAIKIEPDNGEHFNLRGTCHLKQGNLKEAEQDFNIALIKIKPNDPNAAKIKSEILLNQSDISGSKGDTNKQIELLHRACLYNSENLPVFKNFALNLMDSGEYGAANDSFVRILKVKPDDSKIRHKKIFLHERIGDYNKALDDCQILVEKTPNDPLALANLAALHAELGHIEEAKGFMMKASHCLEVKECGHSSTELENETVVTTNFLNFVKRKAKWENVEFPIKLEEPAQNIK